MLAPFSIANKIVRPRFPLIPIISSVCATILATSDLSAKTDLGVADAAERDQNFAKTFTSCAKFRR